jgi:hypothetical protein
MIKFFRNIRLKRLSDNRISKYLLYSIGEIILVVIGILIALQVNNWNEYRKDRIEEQTILSQLKEEYESNLQQLESKIGIRNILIESSQKLLEYINEPEGVPMDSIFTAMSRGSYRPTFDPISNDILSSEKLSLIQDDRLRKLLSQWKSSVYQLNEEEWFWRDYVVESRLPFLAAKELTRKLYHTSLLRNKKPYLLEEIDSNPIVFSDTQRKIDVHEILQDPILEAILTTTIFSATDANLLSGTLKKNIEEILELINASLND